MKRSKTIVRILSIAAFSAASSVAIAQGPGGQMPKVTVAAENVRMTDDCNFRRFTGRIVSPAAVDVTARVAGEIMEVGFTEGSMVKAGQLLYRLDDVKYMAVVKSSQALVAQCKARLSYSQSNYDRVNTLFQKNVASKDSMESALSDLDSNKGALLAAEAALVSAEDDLKHTRITAPIDGKIGENRFAVGNYVTSASGKLVSILQINPVRLRFSMSNRDFLQMFGGAEEMRETAEMWITLADDSIYGEKGVLDFIDNSANESTDTVKIFAKFPNPDGRLIVGSTVALTLSKKNPGKKPAVTPSALLHDADGAYVYVIGEDNIPVRREVVGGASFGDIQIIESGLSEGELVVFDGAQKIIPGVEVNVAK